MAELCRTCLGKEIELVSIFDSYSEDLTIRNIICAITGLKIESGDGLPSTVCRICKQKATNAFDFRRSAIQADAKLNELAPKRIEVKVEINSMEQVKDESDDDVGNSYLDIDFGLDFQQTGDQETHEKVNPAPGILKEEGMLIEVEEKDDDSTRWITVGENLRDTNATYCPLCNTSYSDTAGLTAHMWNRHADIMGPKKRGRPKRLGTTAILNKLSENGVHVKWVTDVKFACSFCSEERSSKDDLDTHVLEHKEMKLIKCTLCKKVFAKLEDLDKHKCSDVSANANADNQQEEGASSTGTMCEQVPLADVIARLPDNECVSEICLCESCGCVCVGQEELNRHRDEDHPELSPRCQLCDKVFSSVKTAARHRTSCKSRERKFPCESCGARFAHEMSLNKHILRAHRGQTVRVRFDEERVAAAHCCDICSVKFSRKDLLARHANVHRPSDKVFECDTCKKKFHRRSNLRQHMRVHEGKTSACLCLYCGRGFSNSSNLIVHMRRHTGEKPYKCDFCGKGFPRSSDLQCHRRSHTGEKPCICGVCGKGFSRSNKLSRHMRVHTGVKPYKCPYCEKAFSQSNDLTLHVRRHTGDKPYVCETCGDRFIQGTALHNHRRVHGHYPESAGYSAPVVVQQHVAPAPIENCQFRPIVCVVTQTAQ
ncbi:zinc finger protein 883-like [Leptidea sinapis]|uniref:zinc finger protein 883-like n=1 Tax=Leptidea sinapis TaxID=189913 RepID=UPI00213BCBD1|nr:zinc finger protein 883-like [Leptidea sinapis]XP_050683678.1 zinc finger protein 883-like [Leptidea sinapis]